MLVVDPKGVAGWGSLRQAEREGAAKETLPTAAAEFGLVQERAEKERSERDLEAVHRHWSMGVGLESRSGEEEVGVQRTERSAVETRFGRNETDVNLIQVCLFHPLKTFSSFCSTMKKRRQNGALVTL